VHQPKTEAYRMIVGTAAMPAQTNPMRAIRGETFRTTSAISPAAARQFC